MRHLNFVAKVAWFYVGLYPITWGIALNIKAGVGAGPWDVFHLGVAGQTGIPVGMALQAVGVAIIALNWFLGIKPTLGMVLNMVSLGPIMQYNLGLLPAPSGPLAGWAMMASGVLLVGVGAAAYTSAGLGAGPRDGLMIALTQRTGWPVSVIKNGMDVTVCLLGWLMGGPLGLGTVVVALTVGPSVQFGMYLMRLLMQVPGFGAVVQPPQLRKTA